MKKKTTGKEYWRSLDQRGQTREYRRWLKREYFGDFMTSETGFSRRKFLGLMGASMALAGLAGCRRPVEKIIPYVNPPEEVIPGVAHHYATTLTRGTEAHGVIVECHEGRPTKVEGNPGHPSSGGAADVWMQAAILGLYDPDRARAVTKDGVRTDYDQFVVFWSGLLERFKSSRGRGLAVLTESFASPTRYRLWSELEQTLPAATYYCYEPLGRFADDRVEFGDKYFRRALQLEQSDVILCVDSDLLLTEPGGLRHAGGFAAGRNPDNPDRGMNRLYVAESSPSVTGAMADHRLRLQSRRALPLLIAVGRALNQSGARIDLSGYDLTGEFSGDEQAWIKAVADDLLQARGRSLVAAGGDRSGATANLVHDINSALGNVGKTVLYYESKDIVGPNLEDFRPLAKGVTESEIDTLVILGGNPVYDQPGGVDLTQIIKGCGASVYLGQYTNETAATCQWHIPEAHPLESWGDARVADGTASVVQPLIAPLFAGRTAIEVLQTLITGGYGNSYALVRETWTNLLKGGDYEKKWQKVLHDGYLADSAGRESSISEVTRRRKPLPPLALGVDTGSADDIEICLRPSPAVHDGRYANNGWLQELPDPITRLAWDNAALVSQRTADELQVVNGDMIEIGQAGRSVIIPIWIQPGQADYSISIPLGYGRTAAGQVGNGVGFNAYPLRAATSHVNLSGDIRIVKTGGWHELANTQDHSSMEGRPIVREGTLEHYRREPRFAEEMVVHPPLRSLSGEPSYDTGYQWGMTIDLTSCIGCNACTIACQSENNIPIVGKEQVINGREMHWLRIDRYFTGKSDEPGVVFQPVPCQQCENAPCETVCPVAATVHDEEGLNQMTYNRCIGTRYCSNNCPYKVRRFNFFNYTKDLSEVARLGQNPDVTVRSRGVMEKCTFCVQRINRAKQQAKKEGRQVRDGEIVTACQQTCPTKAIRFGNINDPESGVTAAKKKDRNYAMLAELNVKPRNTYLARITNPNPLLSGSEEEG